MKGNIMTKYDELMVVAKDAVATVGRLTNDRVRLIKLCETASKNTDDAMATTREALDSSKELLAITQKLRAENDRMKELRAIDAHRLNNALNSIKELENTKWQK
jgi:hypothetical protein